MAAVGRRKSRRPFKGADNARPNVGFEGRIDIEKERGTLMASLTPMMEQYMETKKRHADEILFFRLGDFYEMFFDDAIVASRELEITLTGRDAGLEERIPMCGVPFHAAENYIARLINKGYKVAICEQTGDVKGKGIVKREVIKIITPGTVLSESVLASSNNNYIALISVFANTIVLAGADVSTGECFYGTYDAKSGKQAMLDQLYRLLPPEIILAGDVEFAAELREFADFRIGQCIFTKRTLAEDCAVLDKHFKSEELPQDENVRLAVASLLEYLHITVKNDLSHLNHLVYLDESDKLVIDTYTLRNLEVTRNLRDGGRKDTLLGVLDFTKTAMGVRLLRKWLEAPLINIGRINERQLAVEELVNDFGRREELAEELKEIYDFERLLTRIEVGSANARDLASLRTSLSKLPQVKESLKGAQSVLLRKCEQNIECFADIASLLERGIVDEPSISVRDGGMIKTGYNQELDELRAIAKDSRALLQEMEQREKERTGIKTLKIGYNKVFGYYLEVTNSYKNSVPPNYIRKQTLANAERYITPDLKEFETKILGAQERIVGLEYSLFVEIRDTVRASLVKIQATAHQIAVVDVLTGLAAAAERYGYVKPTIVENGEIVIKDGRHPLVERILTKTMFVPNDTALNHRDSEMMIITGPNMAGKSTYMRQTALLVLMAQAGSFIPAREAAISPVDRIFTRIGASDDLVSGQSTFMVEMNEVAQILKYATKNSLVILDEIGRGTSTFDGMSIARAVIEYIRAKIAAKTMFATHYHELTDMADEDEHIQNYCVAVKERGSEVVFLRRIIKGAADKSYGIHVAKLAGLPKAVTERAKKILAGLENGAANNAANGAAEENKQAKNTGGELTLFASALDAEILSLDVMSMTPLEALNKLYQLQQQVKGENGRL
jgi:DNA mismatch repair protein MutS